MKEVAIIFGGKSVEHDISIITGLQMMKILSRNYNVKAIYIDGKGQWWTGKNLENVSIYSDFNKLCKSKKPVFPVFGKSELLIGRKKFSPKAVVVCCHGINGEDGSVSAVLELVGLPYTCSGILSSAISMDKALTKIILSYKSIENVDFMVFNREEFDKKKTFDEIVKNLGFPLIIKPANLGSSVGISVSRKLSELKEAVKVALEFDDKILIEKFLEDSREFNCACFKFKDKYILSKVAEVDKKDFYTFDEKYILEKDKEEKKISAELEREIKTLTEKTYKALDCFGVVRIDFLYKDEKLYVNEINSIPGAMACYLFSQHFDEILDLLLDESKRRSDKRENICYAYKSDALKIFSESKDLYNLKK